MVNFRKKDFYLTKIVGFFSLSVQSFSIANYIVIVMILIYLFCSMRSM